jgi:hypothetical protein
MMHKRNSRFQHRAKRMVLPLWPVALIRQTFSRECGEAGGKASD